MGAPKFIKNTQGELRTDTFYDFEIVKKMIAPDGENYFIIKDPFGKKHMMEADCYADYNFEIGKTIVVSINKINCKGQVFFEPKHPKYKIGQVFECEYNKTVNLKNKFDQNRVYLEVFAPDGKLNLVETISRHQEREEYSPETIECRIKSISKGQLYLTQYLDK